MQLSPLPLDELRPEMERVFGAALAIPYQELVRMQHVSMGEWLEEQRADALVTMMLLALAAGLDRRRALARSIYKDGRKRTPSAPWCAATGSAPPGAGSGCDGPGRDPPAPPRSGFCYWQTRW